MKIYTHTDPQPQPCAIALGFFDGVHTGHRKLISSMVAYAHSHGLLACVFTFSSSPAIALGKANSRSIFTREDSFECFEKLGVDVCYSVSFAEFKDIEADCFVESLLIDNLNARAVFCGFNYHFGKKAFGDSAVLRDICSRHSIECFVTEPICVDGETVSSSRIRGLIEQGKMFEANKLLAHPFSVKGTITHGKQNGRTVGIPTINQAIPESFVKPRFGVYASFAVIGGRRYNAISNVGVRPTVSSENIINCETHILEELDGEFYGETALTELLWFERDERRFENLQELAQQIQRDIVHINELNIFDLYINGECRHGS